MSAPVIPPIVQRAKAIAAPLFRRDSDANGWAVHLLFLAFLAADQVMWELSEDPGLAETLRPENAAADRPEFLPLAAACNGARITESMTAAQRLVEVRNPSGYARGLPSTILANVAELFEPGAAPRLLVRHHPTIPGDQPDDMTLYVRSSDLAPGVTVAMVSARFAEQMIEGDTGHVVVGAIVADEARAHATTAARARAHATTADAAKGH